jgi:hypothetical protein
MSWHGGYGAAVPPAVHHRVVADPGSGAPVLVKSAADPAGRARLAAEADVLGRLAGLGVVRPIGFHDEGDAAHLHLAWVGPHSLATVTGLPPEGCAAVAAGVAETLAALHERGVVHGAVRPDHVLLAADGRPVLTGLAHAVAPDAARPGSGPPLSPADDVAALGELLVGLVSPTDVGALVPERRAGRRRDAGTRGVLLTLADRATADDPAARPSAAQLAVDLRALAPGRARPGSTAPSPSACPSPPAPRAADARARRRRVVTSATLVGLVGATAAAAWWLGPTPAPDADAAGRSPSTGSGADRSSERSTAPGARVPSTSTTPAPAPPSSTTSAPPTSTAPPRPRTPDPTCPPATPPAADVDGDGCPEALRIEGETVTVGATTWVVGRAGDRPAVGDWDCDGRATVALLRPATGEVFVFGSWALPDAEVTVVAAAVVDDAEQVGPSDPDGDGCPDLVAHRRGRPPVTVPVREAP